MITNSYSLPVLEAGSTFHGDKSISVNSVQFTISFTPGAGAYGLKIIPIYGNVS